MPFDPSLLEQARTPTPEPPSPEPAAAFDPAKLEAARTPDISLTRVAPPHYQEREPLSIGEELTGGVKQMVAPRATPAPGIGAPYPDPGNVLMGGMRAAGALFSPVTNLVSRGAKAIASRYENEPQPPPIQIPNQIDPVTGKQTYINIPTPHPAELYGKMSELAGDIGSSYLFGKAGQLGGSLVKKYLPTIPEKIQAIQAASDARINAIRQASIDAQKAQVAARAAREAGIQPAREAAELGATSDIQAIRGGLQAQQTQVGEQAARAGAPIPPKKTNFQARYQALRDRAAQTETTPENLNAAAYGVKTEAGIAQMTPAERTAAHMQRALTTGGETGAEAIGAQEIQQIEEEVQNTIRRELQGVPAGQPIDYNKIIKGVIGDQTRTMSGDALLNTQKRLNAAESAAYEAGHKNLARQFGVLEDAVKKDLAAADPRVAAGLKAVDRDYFRQKATEWYTNGVQNAFDPKTGVWDRKRFTKWWENHADELNDNKYLRRMLGDKYEGTAQLVKDMQQATDTNIEKLAREAVTNRKKQLKGQLGDIEAKQKGAEELAKQQEQQTVYGKYKTGEGKAKQFEGTAEQVADEAKKKIEDITKLPFNKNAGSWMGPIMVLRGVATANPVTILGGIGVALKHDALMKAMETIHGQSIIRRVMRAAPGTAQMTAAASALQHVVEGTGEKLTPHMAPSPSSMVEKGTIKNLYDRPVLKNPDGSVSTTQSMSFNEDGNEVLIPQVVNGQRLTPAQAIEHYRQTGEHLGKFKSEAAANAYAEDLHNEQARRMQMGGQLPSEPTKPAATPAAKSGSAKARLLKKYDLGD